MSRELAERVGEQHDPAILLEGRRRTVAAVHEIASRVAPGMREADALELVRRTLRGHGFEREWIAPTVQFGANTRTRSGEAQDPDVVLAPEDLWILDVGPLWNGYECDFGDTFVMGGDGERHRLVRDLHAVFEASCDHWRATRATGAAIYRVAAAEAAARGWVLDEHIAGHRLGQYPHADLQAGTLAAADFAPSPGLWMLEIQLRHPDRPYSAFFEDLLVDVD